MARPVSNYPTDLELEILKVLWDSGPAPVRMVRDSLAGKGRNLAYTSVMTIMGIMTRKGYLKRKKADGSFIYTAKIAEKQTTGRMLKDLINRAFRGSPAAAVLNLLDSGDVDSAELKELRAIVEARRRSGGDA